MELSLEIEALAISLSASTGSSLLETFSGFGKGKNSDGLESLSNPGLVDPLIPELARTMLA